MNVKKEEDNKDSTGGSKGEYNPFEHRKVEKPNSDIRSTANLIKASLGSGLLAGPLAFSNAGWGVGIIGTILVGVICGHCIHILVKTSRGCCIAERKPLLGYAETCKSVFKNGPKGARPFANIASLFAEFSLMCTYVGVCCIYTVLIGDSIKQLFDKYVPSVVLPVEYYCLIILIPLCLMCQIKYLKWLAIFSILANILLFVTYLFCLYYIFNGEMNFSDKKAIGNPARYPAFLSPAICAKVCIALSIFFTYPLQFYVVIDIYTKYTDPRINQKYKVVTQVAARVFGVCCCVGIGIALPLLEQIINIVGAAFYSILGLIIPATIETVFRWHDLGKYNWVLWKNSFIVLFGIFCLISGCTVTILDIIKIQHSKTM
ncbi:proton-coupled amino acid transporter-like protein CG1139 isoform X2 [Cydia fagiglandana]|uniref:proton-coupled amino acid transporter-like protein CG1139 isoform X2 n=1 Tax=Cydia fagiglandana TaxID=1458189 RepID=UPI002FEDF2FF